MASYQIKSRQGLSSRQDAPSSIPQRPTSTRLPTRSAIPSSAASHASSALSKLTRKKPEGQYGSRVYGNAAGATSSSQRVATPSKSPGSGAMRRENATGSGRTQPNHSPHPTTTARPPRFDAASTRTPSLMSGSTATASTHDSPGSAFLRRKASSIGRPAVHAARSESSAAREKVPLPPKAQAQDPYADTVLGIAMPPLVPAMDPIDEERRSMLAPLGGQDMPPQLKTDDLPPPTPAYALSASPSTRYSESPGRFSHTSSPTSMSSHSPGVVFPSKLGPRQRQGSPTRSRPPVTRRKTDDSGPTNDLHGLASLHESTASSSSSSTVLAPPSDRRQLMAEHAERSMALRSPLNRELSPGANRAMSPPERPPQITVQTRISVQSIREAPIYPPPELAHLAESKPPPKSAPQKPLRPSREGTPDLSGLQQGPSPVVQSNLTKLPTRHRRQASSGSTISPLSADASRNPSFSVSPNPSVGSTFSPVSAHISTTRGTTPDQQTDSGKNSSSVPPSPSKGTSRFGFFSKRTKSEGAPAPPRKEKKLVRKGPMAGTGHEGYGKYGIGRGRSTSATSVASSYGRSNSQDSVASNSAARPSASRKSSMKSEPEMDGFLRDRLNPKILRGEGSATSSVGANSEADLSATSLGSTKERPGAGSRNDSTVSVSHSGRPSADNNKPTLLPSALADPGRGTSPFRVGGLPGTIRRPSSSDSNLSVNLFPSTSQYGTGPAQSYGQTSASGDLARPKPENKLKKKKEPESKPAKRWNFFQRAHSTPKHEPKPQTPPVQQMPPAISGPIPSRAVAHYALDDAQDEVDLDYLERLMEEAERLGYESSGSRPPSLYRGSSVSSRKHGNSILLPSPPVFSRPFAEIPRPASPKVFLRNAEHPEVKEPRSVPVVTPIDAQRAQPTPPVAPPKEAKPEQKVEREPILPSRPSRLPQVGRIPQVISTRDRNRNLSINSFSRPFVPALPSPATATFPEQVSQDVSLESARSKKQDRPAAETVLPPFARDAMPQPLFAGPVATPNENMHAAPEFFAFPPRKYSELSYTSSSGNSSFPPSTAVIPAPNSPPMEDEVWNEYDDLIDEVLSSPESRGTKRRDGPVRRRSLASTALQEQRPLQLGDAGDRTTVFEEDISPRTSVQFRNSTAASVHLRRSRLLAAFQSLATPSSAGTTSDFPSDEAGRDISLADPHTGRFSLPSMRLSMSSVQQEPVQPVVEGPAEQEAEIQQANVHQAETEPAKRVHFRDSRLIEVAENTKEGAVSMAELRHGALMVSKWLSFGRVLFSPAHFELKNSVEDRILVLDGLGQDWSYYCALTYPTAQVYYISPTPANSSAQSGPVSPAPNHRQIHHPDLLAPFPFPKGFFAAVVFRFPTAAPEHVYRSAISECKRVLRPGGHLEVSVVDLDLVNMGNRARRAVRDLKMRMQSTDPEVCLMNASDAFQRLIGRRGFENLSRCIVGVPTAGKMPKSVDLTNQTGSSNPSTNGMPTQAQFGECTATSGKERFADDDMAKMVARVGRWWYSRCYESMVLQPDDDPSQKIWSDETLRHECEKRHTSFRLLICYAQKPTVTRRRTVSV
ncbi:uncharacterized protein BKCO1_900030 [Diplodia corticola]|uniref:Methyltransferase type 11 domain-containing protein n=1 Tax=Diplodia corticola TaxID=236234 RepID=A0A1J9S8V6_9PEZI|nr:uncharacterized protein BKCO1_900030 [Diplodia corticola]OJD36943.1 hypothetical protein BKCO1_900030 [Diplodia corticola]